jgi:hypothetical protein
MYAGFSTRDHSGNTGCRARLIDPLLHAAVRSANRRDRSAQKPTRKLGLSLILAGAAGTPRQLGAPHARLAIRSSCPAEFLWSCFTVVVRKAKIDPPTRRLVSTGSSIIYLSSYLTLHGTRLAQMPIADIAIRTIFRGVLVIG